MPVSEIDAFRNHQPVRIEFGAGVSSRLADVLKSESVERLLLLVDAGIQNFNPEAGPLLASLVEAGLVLKIYEKPPGEPTVDVVDEATRAVTSSGAQAIVALGGGSVIDTAKAARLCAQLGCTFEEFLASDRSYPTPSIPLVALPTTAGTGSEVSGGAVISDPQKGTKSGIANPLLRAQYALVDPRLTYSTPRDTTVFAGVDALAQAIAALIARSRTPIGDAIGLEAIRMISASLLAAANDGSDEAARSNMACGSMLAGLAMNISDCTAEHSLGQALGGIFHIPHGLTIGLVLVETLRREAAFVPERLDRVADAMNAPPGPADGSRAVEAVRVLLADLDFPLMASIGVGEEHLDELTKLALDDYFITESPSPWSSQEVRHVFESALALESRTL